jgi:uncharacterized protein (TIGR02466 family)
MLAQEDTAGRRWSRDHGYRGYTSYASLNDLPRRDPVFDDLRRVLDRHVARFAEAAAFDLGGRRLKLDSLWVNVLRAGGHHGAHIHPHSVVSGTAYIAVPPGAGGLKLEDPRLPMLMAAPTRRADAPAGMRTFETVVPEPGTILLWESWLRHEVTPHAGKAGAGGERISVSFNYR